MRHGKTHALAGLGICLHGVSHFHQRAGVEHVERSRVAVERALAPRIVRETAIRRRHGLGAFAGAHVTPDLEPLFKILLLDFGQPLVRNQCERSRALAHRCAVELAKTRRRGAGLREAARKGLPLLELLSPLRRVRQALPGSLSVGARCFG